MRITLKPVCKEDYKFLYELLKHRNKDENISHKKVPPYAEHVFFWIMQPYPKSFIIWKDGIRIGKAYITKLEELGMSFIKEEDTEENKKYILDLLKSAFRYINVSPNNKPFNNLLQSEGFVLIQNTYEKNIL